MTVEHAEPPPVTDEIEFPATPHEMHVLLYIEDIAKRQEGFTHAGFWGYIMLYDVQAYEVPSSMRNLMKLGPDGEVVLRVRRATEDEEKELSE